MSFIRDLKSVSDGAIEKLAEQFGDLPRPLLAAIGAGDVTVERLAHLRQQLADRLAAGDGIPSTDDVRTFATDFPGKAQKAAGDVAQHVQEFASAAPEKAQRLIGELPGRAQEISSSLSPEKLRSTVEAYTHTLSLVYGSLADRGGEAVAKVRTDEDGAGNAAHDGDDAASAPASSGNKEQPAGGAATKARTTKARTTKSTASKATAKSGSSKAASTKSAPGKSASPKSASAKSASAKSASAKSASPKSASNKSATTKSASNKAVPGTSATKSA